MSAQNPIALSVPLNGIPAAAMNASSRHVQDAIQTSGKYVTRAVYTTFYCASYGVTFPVVFLAHLIPGGTPLIAGIADGARAARIYVRGVQLSQKRMHRHHVPEHAEAFEVR